jgi:ParB/RepB/Spo0J family partition protein
MNPRKFFSGVKFDELVESVKQKGVIEPIVVRSVEGKKTPYEIVVGERRFKAAGIAGHSVIPALIRELTDDEAYDFMLIENLQREDLTELEEAESFKAYAGRHGKKAIVELAEKTGIRPAYIRARIAVLALPAEILGAWKKGALHYGHLEQLLRLSDKAALKETCTEIKREDLTVAGLKKLIDESRIPLDAARFTAKTNCAGCPSNSTVQQNLFGLGDGKVMCLNPNCFKENQGTWLKEHWLETDVAKHDRTRGFRFDQDIRYGQKEAFYGYSGVKPAKKCLECDMFVTLIEMTGVRAKQSYGGTSTVCIGDKKCFRSVQASSRQIAQAADRSDKKKAVEAGNAPRVSWHGEYFRKVFFRKRVPEILAGLKPEDEKVKALLVMCLAHANSAATAALRKALGLKADAWGDSKSTFPKLLALPYAKVAPIFRAVVEAVFLEGQNVGEWGGFGSTNRRLMAEFLGVDLAKEWAADEEYLQKKTRNELLAFGKKSGIFTAGVVKEYLTKTLKKKVGAFESCEKSELVDVFLKSGILLVGRVPAEILARAK